MSEQQAQPELTPAARKAFERFVAPYTLEEPSSLDAFMAGYRARAVEGVGCPDEGHIPAEVQRVREERDRNAEIATGLAERVHHELHDYGAYVRAMDELTSEDTAAQMAALGVMGAPDEGQQATELKYARETLAMIDTMGRDGLKSAADLALLARSGLRLEVIGAYVEARLGAVAVSPDEGPESQESRERFALIAKFAKALANPECEADCEGTGIDWEGSEWSLCECSLSRLQAIESGAVEDLSAPAPSFDRSEEDMGREF